MFLCVGEVVSLSSPELELTEFDLVLRVVFGPQLELTKFDWVLGVVLGSGLDLTRFDLVWGTDLGLTGLDFALEPGLGLKGLGLVPGTDIGLTEFDLKRRQTLYSCVIHDVRVGRILVHSRRTVWRCVQEILT
jgi:hypothetical protein